MFDYNTIAVQTGLKPKEVKSILDYSIESGSYSEERIAEKGAKEVVADFLGLMQQFSIASVGEMLAQLSENQASDTPSASAHQVNVGVTSEELLNLRSRGGLASQSDNLVLGAKLTGMTLALKEAAALKEGRERGWGLALGTVQPENEIEAAIARLGGSAMTVGVDHTPDFFVRGDNGELTIDVEALYESLPDISQATRLLLKPAE